MLLVNLVMINHKCVSSLTATQFALYG